MRIAIVNDTAMILESLRRIVMSNPDNQLAWLARDGAEAVQRCAANTPDLILMDLVMPVMDGVEATRRIMQESPCAILIVTATVRGNTSKVFEAMGAGALDAVKTPIATPGKSAVGTDMLLAKIATINALISGQKRPARETAAPVRPRPVTAEHCLLAIGASTGGPAALAKVLGKLPADLPAYVLVVQHVDKQFAYNFATWLNDQTALDVRLALDGDRLEQGTVLVAGTDDHLILTADQTVAYTAEPRDYVYRPSVNVLFQSVTAHWPGKAVGLLLTGMGKDGGSGLLQMRQKGWHTITQDEASCAVYGMPKAAVDLGAAVEILPLDEIGAAVDRAVGRTVRLRNAENIL